MRYPSVLYKAATLRTFSGELHSGSTSDPSIQLLADNRTVSFRAGAWTETLPNFAIFDSTFIAENVFSGDAVDLEHKRNLLRVIIGKQGVNFAKEVSRHRCRNSIFGQHNQRSPCSHCEARPAWR